ncbi:hypothetical protein LAZ67_7001493 [Cordylochernes scorpioides]|uniref:Peptidase aspartic putative domain-containing protein n=1 Tax=Cordylochernes scorpioides TaxID=51811 RepID=A0ABY6KPA3_9ARAC|nr:hypothetical protein LAZ67_7001493 [Cordylochernes scorpioides]
MSVVSTLSFVVCYGIGPGPIPWMITAELFAQGPRPAAMSIAMLVNWLANFVSGLVFPILQLKALPIPAITAKTVANAFLSVWVSRFGVPAKVETDHGRLSYRALVGGIQTRHNFSQTRTKQATWEAACIRTQTTRHISLGNLNKNTFSGKTHLELPKFQLPTFSGDISDWLSFKEIFIRSIDQNPTLGNYQKLQYLNSALKGNAARIIRAFNISDEKYPIAWQTLVNRFDRKSELAFKQIQNLYDLKNVKQESTIDLLDLLDTCNESIQNLSILGLERNNLSDMILIHIIQSKLDRSIRKEWEMSLLEKEYPSYEKIISFLERFAGSLGSFQKKENSKQFYKMNKSTRSHSATFASDSSIDSRVKSCLLCKGEHFLLKCPKFNGMMLPERWTFVKDNRLCYNCLRSNHRVSSCVFTQNCKSTYIFALFCLSSCNKRHHTLLHQFKPEMLNPVADIYPLTHASVSCFADNKSHDRILLSTALIKVKSENGVLQTCNALIDTGSQRCLITNSCRKKLNLPLAECKTTVFGLGNKLVEQSMGEVSLQFSPHFSNLIFNANPIDDLPYLKKFLLADPNFDKSSHIDLVIKSELAPCLFNGKVRFQNLSGPTACGSKLGLLLTGKILLSDENSNQDITMFASEDQDDFLKKFWELESVPSVKSLTREEISCEEIYINNLKILEDGRYSVGLPFRTLPTLGESRI